MTLPDFKNVLQEVIPHVEMKYGVQLTPAEKNALGAISALNAVGLSGDKFQEANRRANVVKRSGPYKSACAKIIERESKGV